MQPRTLRALLIEDDPEDALFIKYLLSQGEWPGWEFQLDCAETLAAGLEALARGQTQVVMLDLMLPDSRGVETVRRVHERFPDVPIVVLTGMQDEAMGLEAILEGAQDYQVKGAVDAHAFKRTLSFAVERQRLVARFKGLIDRSADGMVVVDARGLVRYANAAAQTLLGPKATPGGPFPFTAAPDSAREVALEAPGGARLAEMRVTGIEWEGEPATLASIRDITDLRRVEQLRAEVKERRRMDKLKDELMSAVSHEMRNPLTIIKAAAINLKEAMSPPVSEEQATMMQLQLKNIQRLQKILDNVLDLSRLESGKAAIRPRRVDASQLVAETARGYQLVAAERGLRVDIDAPGGLPPLKADPELFFDVLGNLLGNAIRFARSRIVVRAAALARAPAGSGRGAQLAERPCLQFSVVDDGRGIPPERLGELFSKFVQLDREGDADGYKGTGLGLAICKEIVERQGGRIWAESAPGEGARFHFVLPQWETAEDGQERGG